MAFIWVPGETHSSITTGLVEGVVVTSTSISSTASLAIVTALTSTPNAFDALFAKSSRDLHEITALENLEKFYETIERDNPKINAFLEVKIDEARALAEGIDKKIQSGEKTGKLAGLVVGVKSNINVEDFHITAASRTLENYLGSYDATVVKRIKEEDGIIIGMTNMLITLLDRLIFTLFNVQGNNIPIFKLQSFSELCIGYEFKHILRMLGFHWKNKCTFNFIVQGGL